ncbi:hypothetical protein H4R34_000766 [Dimargaris verticillata]|uniref:alpha-1,2-Mannosidase n=1 Tax=Dimargaris verticillata TaxID=2761393 RepID=A0A9W8BCN2_9FUNG|nr:hypothetical protein H4R34_000766 [Dimargaris verticillata]
MTHLIKYGCLALAFASLWAMPGQAQTENVVGDVNAYRRNHVRQTLKRAWDAYMEHAAGYDELLPVSRGAVNNLSVTPVDALDSLWMMGLKREFQEACNIVAKIDFSKASEPVSFFETGIRVLGGLLSAHEMSGNWMLLEKAVEIGDLLLIAFDTPTGFPKSRLDLSKKLAYGTRVLLAEVGTIQLEFAKLSQFTRNPKYDRAAQRVIHRLDRLRTDYPGLIPAHLDAESGQAMSDLYTFGAMGDSYYEYLIKYAVLTDRKHGLHGQMYTKAINSMKLVMLTTAANHPDDWYLPELHGNRVDSRMHHLTCFAPGMLALGSHFLGVRDDMDVAKQLMKTCIKFYRNTATGLGPESVKFNLALAFDGTPESNGTAALAAGELTTVEVADYRDRGYTVDNRSYQLRPETIESLLYLYRLTGNPIYQSMGWDAYKALERFTRAPAGYATIKDVETARRRDNQYDAMPSFFLAETLKYLFLLFSDKDVYSLDDYVFNTEAHPFKIIR